MRPTASRKMQIEARKSRPERLREACLKGDLTIVKTLLHEKTDINDADEYGNTPLILGADSGNLEVVEELLSQGPKINAVDNYGQTALLLAAFKGNFKICQLLLEKKARVNHVSTYGLSALSKACNGGYQHSPDIVELLCDHKANLENASKEKKEMPIHIASKCKNIGIVRVLVEKKANIDAPNGQGDSALMYAARAPSYGMISELVRLGANDDLENKKGETVYSIKPDNSSSKLTADQLNDLVLDAVKLGHDLAKEDKKTNGKDDASGWEAGRKQRELERKQWEEKAGERRASIARLLEERDAQRKLRALQINEQKKAEENEE